MAMFKKEKSKKPRVERTGEAVQNNSLFVSLVPHITEKAASLEAQGQYVFRIGVGVTKGVVEREVFARYGVWPQRVNIQQARPKERRRGAFVGFTSGHRKAIVTLPKGKKIDIMPK